MIKTIKYKFNSSIRVFLFNRKKRKKRKEILAYYKNNQHPNSEITAAVDYLKQHALSDFYGAFQHKYCADDVEVYTDIENGLNYIVEQNKCMYFKRSHNKRTVQLIYNQLMIEQDPESTHCYTDDQFFVNKDTILADVGCAEGYFSFQHIEEIKKVYLFESDPEWIEALEATFKPWNCKVQIVKKFVSDQTTQKEISLDDFFAEKTHKPNFFKIDVEGAEQSVLNGMKDLFKKPPLQIALCTYHNKEDLDTFTSFFENLQYHVSPNPGLMIYSHDLENLQAPYFRTGLIKASKYD